MHQPPKKPRAPDMPPEEKTAGSTGETIPKDDRGEMCPDCAHLLSLHTGFWCTGAPHCKCSRPRAAEALAAEMSEQADTAINQGVGPVVSMSGCRGVTAVAGARADVVMAEMLRHTAEHLLEIARAILDGADGQSIGVCPPAGAAMAICSLRLLRLMGRSDSDPEHASHLHVLSVASQEAFEISHAQLTAAEAKFAAAYEANRKTKH